MVYHRGMKTTAYDPATRQYTTNFGVFTVSDGQSPNRFEYFVTKVSGEWPTKEQLGAWLNSYYTHFGGTVQIGVNTAYASIYGAD
jgi:hypothetical protein